MTCLMKMNTLQQPPCDLRLSFQSEIAVVSNGALDSDTTFFRREHKEVTSIEPLPRKIHIFLFPQLVPKQFLSRTGKIKGCEQWVT